MCYNTFMKITVIKPYGFCNGVVYAINLAIKTRVSNPQTPIYVWGPLVHNHLVIEQLTRNNIITLDQSTPLEELLKPLDKGFLITSAHGVSEDISKKIKMLGFKHVDATCPLIKKMHIQIKKELADNHEILFYGQKNHAECLAVLSIDSEHIHPIYDYQKSTKLLLKDKSPAYFAQTTMILNDSLNMYHSLKQDYDGLRFIAANCNATSTIQNNLITALPTVDAVIVVGDKTSNNAENLISIVKKHNKTAFFIETIKDLNIESVLKYEKVALVSAASTPNDIFEDVIKTLSKFSD